MDNENDNITSGQKARVTRVINEFKQEYKELIDVIKNFQKEDFVRDLGIPDLQEDIGKMPKIEFPEITMPELNEEELKALDEELEGAGSVQESEGSI